MWRERLVGAFGARVRGPMFEETARTWVQRFADLATLGGVPHHVGPSGVVIDGFDAEVEALERERDAAEPPQERDAW